MNKPQDTFIPPSMLAMPYSSFASRRASQEDAYIAWCDARIHDQRDEETRSLHMDEAMNVVRFLGDVK